MIVVDPNKAPRVYTETEQRDIAFLARRLDDALAGNLSIKAQPGGAAHIELIVTQEKCKRGMGSTVVSIAPMGNE